MVIDNQTDSFTQLKVKADLRKITQVMLNLLSNAIKYTQKHGKIVLTREREHNHLKIVVSDNGIGISRNEIENIFTPFYRIYNKEFNIEGSGIGLSIVKQFIQEMKGTVGIESIPGEGSKFWFTLPILNEEE